MYYRKAKIRSFYLMDMDNLDNAQKMLRPENKDYYRVPDSPQYHMSAPQIRDMMNVVSSVAERIGGYPDRITWWVEVEELKGQLVEVTDYNELENY